MIHTTIIHATALILHAPAPAIAAVMCENATRRRAGASVHGQLALEGVAPLGEESEPLDRVGKERGFVRFRTASAWGTGLARGGRAQDAGRRTQDSGRRTGGGHLLSMVLSRSSCVEMRLRRRTSTALCESLRIALGDNSPSSRPLAGCPNPSSDVGTAPWLYGRIKEGVGPPLGIPEGPPGSESIGG